MTARAEIAEGRYPGLDTSVAPGSTRTSGEVPRFAGDDGSQGSSLRSNSDSFPSGYSLATALGDIGNAIYQEQPEFDAFDLAQLWEIRRWFDTIISAAKGLRELVDGEIADKLAGGSARFDDSFIRVVPVRTARVYNAEGLFNWLGPDVRAAFNPQQVRLTAIRAIAEKRGQTPEAVVNSFIDFEEGETRLQVLPLNKAPKYAASLNHGDVVPPRKQKGTAQ